ncbi:MAG: SsgA family sporulation/cell division regulator [Streptomyces sp.]|uniref:SsgA family sporulation/cell division regulator n=1 Tax=Streptomyces sp. TaxID=1931 RepID=UPI003D6B1191
MDIVVERDLDVRLMLSPEHSLPVPARLTYRAKDPYAAHIAFHIGSGAPVAWTFARELLIEGVSRPCGEGDVRVWPVKVQGRDVICLALSSPDGDALLETSAAGVCAWLERTLRAVPQGRECEVLSLDTALAELLTGGPGHDVRLRDPEPSDESGESSDPAGSTP